MAIQHHTNELAAVKFHIKSLEAYYCLSSNYQRVSDARYIQKEYDSILMNTPDRIRAVMKVNSYRHGSSIPEHMKDVEGVGRRFFVRPIFKK